MRLSLFPFPSISFSITLQVNVIVDPFFNTLEFFPSIIAPLKGESISITSTSSVEKEIFDQYTRTCCLYSHCCCCCCFFQSQKKRRRQRREIFAWIFNEAKKSSPLTIKFIFNFIFGSVLIWHSYSPWSSILTFVMTRLQSVASTLFSWLTLNLVSAVNVAKPAVKIVVSELRIQNTNLSSKFSMRHDKMTVDPSITETDDGTFRKCGWREELSSDEDA